LLAARKIASDLGFAESGYRVLINCNQDGGQDVWHLHLHVLAGRRMGWPPG
jgi:histidine triad (HIT) family protein